MGRCYRVVAFGLCYDLGHSIDYRISSLLEQQRIQEKIHFAKHRNRKLGLHRIREEFWPFDAGEDNAAKPKKKKLKKKKGKGKGMKKSGGSSRKAGKQRRVGTMNEDDEGKSRTSPPEEGEDASGKKRKPRRDFKLSPEKLLAEHPKPRDYEYDPLDAEMCAMLEKITALEHKRRLEQEELQDIKGGSESRKARGTGKKNSSKKPKGGGRGKKRKEQARSLAAEDRRQKLRGAEDLDMKMIEKYGDSVKQICRKEGYLLNERDDLAREDEFNNIEDLFAGKYTRIGIISSSFKWACAQIRDPPNKSKKSGKKRIKKGNGKGESLIDPFSGNRYPDEYTIMSNREVYWTLLKSYTTGQYHKVLQNDKYCYTVGRKAIMRRAIQILKVILHVIFISILLILFKIMCLEKPSTEEEDDERDVQN